jgi:hypothetical protein
MRAYVQGPGVLHVITYINTYANLYGMQSGRRSGRNYVYPWIFLTCHRLRVGLGRPGTHSRLIPQGAYQRRQKDLEHSDKIKSQ